MIQEKKEIYIREVDAVEKKLIDQIVEIHLKTFTGFFLTFLGRGFLNQMYCSYCEEKDSGLLVAFEDKIPVGFLAYSGNLSGLYKYMIKKRLLPFAWYALGGFIRKPSIFMRLLRAFLKPGEVKREESYIELASIGVMPQVKSKGIGSKLINELKQVVDYDKYSYITLETDAVENDYVNRFYQRNGFNLVRSYETHEGRKMNEYRYYLVNSETDY